MKKYKIILGIFIGVAMLYFISTVEAGICECNSCESCTEKLNDDSCSEVKLIDNIAIKNISDYCVRKWHICINIFNTNNKIFDCQGNKIKDLVRAHHSKGIFGVNASNITIKNCIISGFGAGIVISGGANNKIVNNSISFCSYDGILFGGIFGKVIGNDIYKNYYHGVELQNSSNITIINNKIHSNGDGIYLYLHANFNKIENNKIYNNSRGIYMTNLADSDRDLCSGVDSPPMMADINWSVLCSGFPNTGNEIIKNEITKNKIGIVSYNSNFTLNSNIICENKERDIISADHSVIEGNNNACDKVKGWNNCTYKCNETQLNKPTKPDYNLILSIAIIGIVIFLSAFVIWYKRFKK